MNVHQLSIGLVAVILAACSSAPERGDRAADVVAAPPAATARPRDPLSAAVSDPDLARRIAASFVAESDFEPRLDADEQEMMAQVMELVAAEETARAISLLAGNTGPASSATLDFTLANLYFQREQLPEAIASYRLAVDKHPEFKRAWANLAQLQYQGGDMAGAVESFSRLIPLGGADAVIYGMLGVAHMRLQDPTSAESAFRMASMLDPGTVNWKLGLAQSFYEQGRFADAAALFRKLIRDDPDRAEFWLAQGEAFARLDRPLEAAKNFEVVDRLGGSNRRTLQNLGDIYANQQLYDLAVGAYVRAMEMEPNADSSRVIRSAQFLCANGALDETAVLVDAIESLRGELIDDAQRKSLLELRARIAAASGATAEQARVLARIVELDPLDGQALIQLGLYHAGIGESELAVFYYERAAGLEGWEAEAKVSHAQLLVGRGEYAAALPLLRRAQALEPRDNVQDYLDQVERVAQAR